MAVASLQSVALALLGLHLFVRTLPLTPTPIPAPDSAEAAWWGLWPVTYLPVWAVGGGVLLVVGAVVLWWWSETRGSATVRTAPGAGRSRLLSFSFSSRSTPRWLAIVSLFLCGAFFFFPIAHTRWGDAFMLANGIAFPDLAVRLTHSWQAPLDVFLHSQLWLLLHTRFGWADAVPAYRLLSPLAGALYLLVALALSRDERLAPGWLTYGLLATLGLLQLFFGYVENYSFAAVGVLAYLWLGIGVLRGDKGLWLAATILAITNATHPSTVILAPSLLYLGWQMWRDRNKSALSVVVQIALPLLLVGSATFFWMELSGHGLSALLNTDRPGGGDGRWFVPLWATTTQWEHYTMFSWPHVRDWLNEQLLVAPVVLPGLTVVAANLWWAKQRGGTELRALADKTRDPYVRITGFLLIASAFYLLFTFVWNPDYGGQRDWDLFSLAALPATLLFALLLLRLLRQRHYLWGAAVPLLLLQAWHTAAWIYQNTLPWQWPD